MIFAVGAVLMAVGGIILWSARSLPGHPDFRRMWGGYFAFLGAFYAVGYAFGYRVWSYHFVFEIIFALTALAFSFLLVQHIKYNRAEAAIAAKRATPVNDDKRHMDAGRSVA